MYSLYVDVIMDVFIYFTSGICIQGYHIRSRDHKGVDVAHEKTSPKNQPHFSLTVMRQYWLGKLSLNKPSGEPETLLQAAT